MSKARRPQLTHQLPCVTASVVCAAAQITAFRRLEITRDQVQPEGPNPIPALSPQRAKES